MKFDIDLRFRKGLPARKQFPAGTVFMQFSHIFFGAALIGLCAVAAKAETDSMPVGMVFSITNTGEETLECAASIAHWFSEEIGTVAAGETLTFDFGYARDTGTIFRVNSVGDEMAVQRIWCGAAGRAWETRFELPLLRAAGATPEVVDMTCHNTGARTSCDAR